MELFAAKLGTARRVFLQRSAHANCRADGRTAAALRRVQCRTLDADGALAHCRLSNGESDVSAEVRCELSLNCVAPRVFVNVQLLCAAGADDAASELAGAALAARLHRLLFTRAEARSAARANPCWHYVVQFTVRAVGGALLSLCSCAAYLAFRIARQPSLSALALREGAAADALASATALGQLSAVVAKLSPLQRWAFEPVPLAAHVPLLLCFATVVGNVCADPSFDEELAAEATHCVAVTADGEVCDVRSAGRFVESAQTFCQLGAQARTLAAEIRNALNDYATRKFANMNFANNASA